MRFLVILFTGTGILLALISLPMIARKIKPNPFYGYRVRKTLENPEIWYDANEYSGRQLFVAGVVIAIFSMVLPFLPGMSLSLYSGLGGLVNVIFLIIAFVRSSAYLKGL
jgi:uncharacterized membrane protein